jgi:hypothetical protein
MFADSVSNRDAAGVDSFSVTDLAPESVRRYREFFAAKRPGYPFLSEGRRAFCSALRRSFEIAPAAPSSPPWAAC